MTPTPPPAIIQQLNGMCISSMRATHATWYALPAESRTFGYVTTCWVDRRGAHADTVSYDKPDVGEEPKPGWCANTTIGNILGCE